MIDSYYGGGPREEARRLDTEKRWQDVPAADIARYHWILSFLDPIGFRYYLPAYMVWTLKNYECNDSMSDESTIFALGILEKYHAHIMERFVLFSRPQAEAVCAFLRFIEKYAFVCGYNEDAHKALKQYWGRFCPPNDPATEREP